MKKNYLFNLLQSVVNILFPIISFPYAAHILGPVGIGKVQFAISFAQYFALIAALGIPIYGIKEVAQCRGDKGKLSAVFSELICINVITGILLSAVYLAVVYWFPYFQNDKGFYASACVIIILGFSTIDWFYSGIEEFKGLALRNILMKLLSLVLLFFMVKTASDYDQYLLIIIFSFTANNLLSFVMLRGRAAFRLGGLRMQRHLKPLVYILSTTVAASMYTLLDSVLLGFLADEKAVGLYTAAVKLTRITLPLITSLGAVLIPRIAKGIAEGNMEEVQSLLDKSFHFLIVFSIPVMAGLAMLAPEFIVVFSGDEFRDGVLSMQILSVLPILVGFGHFFAFQILVPANRNREMFLSVLGGVVVALILNFLLVPRFQDVGEAIANVCSEVTVSVLYFFYVRKYFAFTYQWPLAFKSGISAMLFIPLVIFIRSLQLTPVISLTLSIASCGLVYFVVMILVFRDQFILDFIGSYTSKLRFRRQTADSQ